MIPVKVDISNTIDRYELSQEQVKALSRSVVDALAESFANNMRNIARTKLTKTRQEFIDGINVVSISDTKSAVELIGFMPNAVTLGIGAFDMKEGFAKSSKKKTTKKGGWYLTVPFRLATPNSVASSSVFSGKMPTAVYNVAKKLKSKESLRATSLPVSHSSLKFRPAVKVGDTDVAQYKHKSPIYAGITRSTLANHVKYTSFRRVSSNSDQDSWIHTGIEARNIHIEAIDRMDVTSVVRMSIDNFLDNR